MATPLHPLHLSRLSDLGEALLDAVVTYRDNTALIEVDRHRDTRRLSYRDARVEAENVGSALQAHGFAPGDRLAILLSNQSRWLTTAMGAFWSGAVVVPVDYKLTPAEQVALLRHAQPKVVVTEYPTWQKLRMEDGAREVLEDVRIYLSDVPAGASLPPRVGRLEAIGLEPSGPFVRRTRLRSDQATLVYSSGTGGTPKGCQLTHGNYLSQAEVLGNLFPMAEDDRYFSILPTNHAIDFCCGFLIPLLMGASVVHQRTLRPQFLTSTMKRYGVTHMAIVPLLLKTLRQKLEERLDALPSWQRIALDGLQSLNELATLRAPRHRVSSTLLKPIHDELGGRLRLMFCGGAFVDAETAEFFSRLGLPVVIGYGLTEAGVVLTVNDLKPFRADTVGRPIPGTEVVIRDANSEGVGEVWVRGPSLMAGYRDAPELTAETLVDGWLRTGDLGLLDLSGHLKLVGRSKNMIVTEGGKNVYPEDLEAAFEGLRDTAELAVFAANFIWPTGKLTEEQLCVVIRPKTGAELSPACLEDLGRRNRQLTDYKRLSGVVVCSDEFPRTASMKVKRLELALRLRESLTRDNLRPL